MPLSDAAVRNAKAKAKPYKLADGEGLYLLVSTTGSRLWRMNYAFGGKQKTLAIGQFPAVKLAEARDHRAEAKRHLAAGVDPSAAKRLHLGPGDPADSFRVIAKEWFAVYETGIVPAYSARVWSRLEDDVLPEIGGLMIRQIKPTEILTMLRKVEGRGAIEMAKRIKQSVSAVFKYAIATGRAEHDPTAHLAPALKPSIRSRHFTKLPIAEMPAFLLRLETYDGEETTRLAMELLLRTWTRTKEIRLAEKAEFDGDLWRIPAARMKMSRDHLIPLSPQAQAIVTRLSELSGPGPLLAPGLNGRPMSENTLIYAMYRMGYRSRATVHGLRGTASTYANESGLWHQDWIERQLAHADDDEVRSAYNAAEYLEGRRRMLDWWSNFLDGQLEIGRLLG
jgi:integrase